MALPKTPSQTVGPYYAIGLCRRPDNELVPPDSPGAIALSGRLVDGQGNGIDGMVELWDGENWGRSATGDDGDGRFQFTVARPPARTGEAPHLEIVVFARGLLKHQFTRMYFPGDEANERDPILSQLDAEDRESLVARADGEGALHFQIRMQGEGATVFFAV